MLAARSSAADPTQDATNQLRHRLRAEWQTLVDADKSLGWEIHTRASRLSGDWVVRLDGWTYFFRAGVVICRVQPGEVPQLTCDGEHWTDAGAGQIAVLPARRTPTLDELRVLHHGFGAGLPINRDGSAVLETIVSTPNAPDRTSWRYRARVTVTTRGFAIEPPILVEQYRETCFATHGCHDTHWYCTRVK